MTVSVPSWVVPGSYAENLRFLADKDEIDGVELLFFLYDDEARALFRRERDEIRALSGRFRYTLHLPDALEAAHEELLEASADFVNSYVAHPSPPEKADRLAALLDSWRSRYGDRFYLENTHPGRLEALRERLPDAPLCMDTGHLLLEGRSPARFAAEAGGLVREVHLHGLGLAGDGLVRSRSDGRLPDHRVFSPDAPWFRELEPFLAGFGGTVNCEVFSWAEASGIVDIARAARARSGT